jgi:hypothetical protein
MLIRVKAVGYEEDNRAFEENLRPYQAMDSEFKVKKGRTQYPKLLTRRREEPATPTSRDNVTADITFYCYTIICGIF